MRQSVAKIFDGDSDDAEIKLIGAGIDKQGAGGQIHIEDKGKANHRSQKDIGARLQKRIGAELAVEKSNRAKCNEY